MKKFICLLAILLLPSICWSADHYVRDGATGANSGSNWADAWDDLPSTFARGDTYYVADGTYGNHSFDTAASGSTYIYIKKAIESSHGTETGWNSAYGNGQAVFSQSFRFESDYWSIDGQVRTGWDSGYGIQLAPPGSCSTKGVRIDPGVNYITLRYLQIEGGGPDGNCSSGANDIIYTNGGGNVTLQYSWLHDAGRTHILSRNGSGWLLEYNFMDKCESTSGEHSESWSMGRTSDTIVRYNWFNETEGTGVLVTLDNNPGPDNWEIYGNLFTDTDGGSGRTVGTDSESTWTNVRFYNNTIIGGPRGHGVRCDYASIGTDETDTCYAYNNIFFAVPSVIFDVNHDYNAFDSGNGIEGESHGQIISDTIFTNYSGDNFTLAEPTNPGITLGSPYNIDLNGLFRGADGLWDRGAFEYNGEGPGDAIRPNPPSGLAGEEVPQ